MPGFFGWLAWLVLHLFLRDRPQQPVDVDRRLFVTFASHSRSQMAITCQMIHASLAVQMLRPSTRASSATDSAMFRVRVDDADIGTVVGQS